MALGGSVVSAAIIEGSLILGLSDGSILNCGYVQGPQGLKGDPGPIGATGEPGRDGNTIHTVGGTPGNEMGVEGDYAIDNINWRIYGPKAGGVWGKAKSMLPDPENLITNGRTASGATGGGGGEGGGQPIGQVFTNTVIATGQGRLVGPAASVDYPGGPGNILPPATGLQHQANINAYFVDALEALEGATVQEILDRIDGDDQLRQLIQDEIAGAVRPAIYADTPPTVHPDYQGADAALQEGDVWYDTSNDNVQYRYVNDEWVAQSRPPIYAEDEPANNPNLQGPSADLKPGDIWFDTSDGGLLEYIWSGTEWVEAGGAYVQKKGDTMLGALLLKQVDGNDDKVPQELTDTSDPATSTPKKYVDEKDELLYGKIIELEEELEGLAPSLVRGSWKYSEDFTKPSGEFGARTSGNGIPTDWESVVKLIFNEVDEAGVQHGFGDIEDGTYFQIFEQGSDTAAMFQATGAATTNGDQVEVNVTHVQSVENTSATVGESYRFKIFALNDDTVDVTGFLKKTSDTIGKGGGQYTYNPDTIYKVKLKNKTGWPDNSPALIFQGDPSNGEIYGTYFAVNDLGFKVAGNAGTAHNVNGQSNLAFVINPGRSSSDQHSVRRWGTIYDANTDEVTDVGYVNKAAIRSALIPQQQIDWANQTYSSGIWILQDDPGQGDPDIQRFMLSDASFADVRDSGLVRYISVHALGGGDFITYQNEKPGDLIHVYGSPIPKSQTTESPDRPDADVDRSNARRMQLREAQDRLAFGIYEIENIQEHNFPDNINGGDFTNAFITYTVKPLATANEFLTDDLCSIKTMPDPVKSGGKVSVGDNPPDSASEGDQWYETYTDTLFIYVGGEWKPVVDPIYEPDYTALGRWQYKRSGDSDFGGVFRNLAAGGAQPHDSLTRVRVNNTPEGGSGPVIDPNSWQPGQFLSIEKGGDKVIYKITAATASTNYGDLTLEFIELEGSPFTFYVDDRIRLGLRKEIEVTEYLPLTGGSLTGNLNVGGQLKVTGEKEFRVEYADGTNFYRVRPDNSTVTVKGAVNADGRVKGSELVSTKLTSGQSSNLQIYRGNGADEQRKMLIGTDSVNFDVGIRLVGSDVNGNTHKDIQVLNGTKLWTGSGEIITFGGDGAFYRGNISVDDHIVNRGWVNEAIGTAVENIDIPDVDLSGYLPLTGGDITGATTISNGNQVALTIKNGNQDKIKFWGSGAVALVSGYTAFKDDELITKKYADDADATLVAKAGSTMTGALTIQRSSDQLFVGKKDNSTTCEIYADGTFQTTKTSFADNNLVTKKYVDDKVAAGGSSFTPGQKVAKDNSTGVEVGGFYINNGNLYVKLS